MATALEDVGRGSRIPFGSSAAHAVRCCVGREFGDPLAGELGISHGSVSYHCVTSHQPAWSTWQGSGCATRGTERDFRLSHPGSCEDSTI